MRSEKCYSGVDMKRGRFFRVGKINKINFFVSFNNVFTATER